MSSVYGSCYKISSEKLVWISAKTACEALGSNLVILNSISEIQNVIGKAAGFLWIGLQRDFKNKSRWLWVDGSEAFFTYWWSGEPNQANSEENCAVMTPYVRKWNDIACTGETYNYICEIKGKHRFLIS